jgi:hypothetical protein
MKSVVITLLIAVLIFFIFDKSKYIGQDSVIVTTTDTIYSKDTIVKIKKGKDIPFEIYRVLEDSIFIHDTIQVLSDYYATRVYKDTITQDSSKFYIQDSISQNKILNRLFKAEITYKTIYNTTTITKPEQNAIYLGFLTDLRAFDNKVGIGVGLGFKMAKKGLILGSITTNQYSIGYYGRIY